MKNIFVKEFKTALRYPKYICKEPKMNQTREKTKQLIENCRLICRNEPDKIENWLDLGRALLEDARYDEAEQALTKIFDEGRFFPLKTAFPACV